MKKILIATGALLLSSPAFAYAPPGTEMAPDMAKAVKQLWADVKTDAVKANPANVVAAAETWIGTPKPMAFTPASATSIEAKGDKDKPAAAGEDVTLAGELGGPSKPAMPAGEQYTGMGGPIDDGADDYPPCSRTVRDRCIQLYERGVGR